MVPGRGLFAPPERFDQRPFSAADAAKVVTEAAVETLRARGEPARMERLFGEILVGLDRAGHLRRLASGTRPADAAGQATTGAGPAGAAASPATAAEEGGTRPDVGDPVERLLTLIRQELTRPDQRRVVEIEPGRWWLGDETDRAAAAAPLADRVEWAVFSLLSTAGPLSEAAFYERMATMFSGHDLPDETLVRACLESYRSLASTPDRLVTGDDLLKRSQEHSDLLASLTEAGHRIGMRVWLAQREQARRHDHGTLGDLLDDRERNAYLGSIGRPTEDLAEVDAIWYIRGKVALLFEVEWTAILGEPLLRRHARIGSDERLIRFLAIAPERTDLVRHKLERSPLLRAAMDDGAWNIIKWDHLRTFLAADQPDLDDLEPLLGLDPVVERGGEQMPLFGG
jgi:hypothetical protein